MKTPENVTPAPVGSGHLVLPPKSFVQMFKPRFAALVEAGTKTQTVRPTPARMPKPGDKLSLRMWTGKPYRSKQRVLREATVLYIAKIKLDSFDMWFDGVRASGAKQDAFARADGFSTAHELLDWFENEHGLPFEGVVIVWQNDKISNAGPKNYEYTNRSTPTAGHSRSQNG